MAIEFTCPNCDHLLRTGEEKSGLSAKCPACGEAIWVPYPHEARSPSERTEEKESFELEEIGEADSLPPEVFEDAPAIVPPPPPPAIEEEDLFEPPVIEEEDGVSSPPPKRRVAATAEVNCPSCYAANDPAATRCRFCGESLEGVEPVAPPSWTPPIFDVGEVMSTTWRIYTDRMGLLIGAMLLMMVSFIAAEFVIVIPVIIAVIALQSDALFVLIPGLVVAIPIFMVIGSAFMVGQTRLYMNTVRGSGPEIMDLFYGFGEGRSFILRGFLVSLTATALILLGTLLCCAPGVIVALSIWPALPILLDRDPPDADIVGMTFEFIKRDFGSILAIGAIAFGIQFVAQLIPYLSIILILFVAPFVQLLTMVAYHRLTEQKTVLD